MSFTGISVFLSVIVLNIYEKSKNTKSMTHRLPYFIRLIILDYLASFFGIKNNEKNFFELMMRDSKNYQSFSKLEIEQDLFNNISNDLKQRKRQLDDKKNATSIWRKRSKIQRYEQKEIELKRQIKEENLKLYYSFEWLHLSLVIDRIIFWIFTTTTIICYIITLFIMPFVIQPNKYEFLIHLIE